MLLLRASLRPVTPVPELLPGEASRGVSPRKMRLADSLRRRPEGIRVQTVALAPRDRKTPHAKPSDASRKALDAQPFVLGTPGTEPPVRGHFTAPIWCRRRPCPCLCPCHSSRRAAALLRAGGGPPALLHPLVPASRDSDGGKAADLGTRGELGGS